jgi:hypothetical protein
MQEPKKVQFNLRNSTTREVSIDLFNASSITPITNETQFEAGAVNTLSPFSTPTNGFYNPLTNETILFNTQDGIGIVNQETSTMSAFLNDPITNDIVAMVLCSANNNLYVGNNKASQTETNVLVLDAITYAQITEITIPNPTTTTIQIMDMSYSPVNNYVYVNIIESGVDSYIIYIDCATNTIAGTIPLP